jgi:CheY-like chemotaxis protein
LTQISARAREKDHACFGCPAAARNPSGKHGHGDDQLTSNLQAPSRQLHVLNTDETVAPSSSQAEDYGEGAAPGRSVTALCIDGDRQMHEIYKRALAGYNVCFASSAYEALRSINSKPSDVYVLDYWLPDWSGCSLCRAIRKPDPHVPVCFCTSASRPQDEQRARRAGASAYVLKPTDAELLSGVISALVQAAAARNRSACQAADRTLVEELLRRRSSWPNGVLPALALESIKRSSCNKAREVFIAAGGTLAGFERRWKELWQHGLEVMAGDAAHAFR